MLALYAKTSILLATISSCLLLWFYNTITYIVLHTTSKRDQSWMQMYVWSFVLSGLHDYGDMINLASWLCVFIVQ